MNANGYTPEVPKAFRKTSTTNVIYSGDKTCNTPVKLIINMQAINIIFLPYLKQNLINYCLLKSDDE